MSIFTAISNVITEDDDSDARLMDSVAKDKARKAAKKQIEANKPAEPANDMEARLMSHVKPGKSIKPSAPDVPKPTVRPSMPGVDTDTKQGIVQKAASLIKNPVAQGATAGVLGAGLVVKRVLAKRAAAKKQ